MKNEDGQEIHYGREYDERLRKAHKGHGRVRYRDQDQGSELGDWDKPCPPTRFEVLG